MRMSLSGARPIVIGRLPMGISLSASPRNFKTSLAISATSCKRHCVRRPARAADPPPQPAQHATDAWLDAQHYNGDVVFAAVVAGQRDQAIRGGLRTGAGDQVAGDFGSGNLAR